MPAFLRRAGNGLPLLEPARIRCRAARTGLPGPRLLDCRRNDPGPPVRGRELADLPSGLEGCGRQRDGLRRHGPSEPWLHDRRFARRDAPRRGAVPLRRHGGHRAAQPRHRARADGRHAGSRQGPHGQHHGRCHALCQLRRLHPHDRLRVREPEGRRDEHPRPLHGSSGSRLPTVPCCAGATRGSTASISSARGWRSNWWTTARWPPMPAGR